MEVFAVMSISNVDTFVASYTFSESVFLWLDKCLDKIGNPW